MSEKTPRNIFVFVTLASPLGLGVMTLGSLPQVISSRTPRVIDQVSLLEQPCQAKRGGD